MPSDSDALARIAEQLAAMRTRLDDLATDNQQLRSRLEASERARAELLAQTEHLIEVLARSRQQLREAKGEA